MQIEYKIIIKENPLMARYDIYYYRRTQGYKSAVVRQNGFTITEEEFDDTSASPVAPTLTLTREMLQQLANELNFLNIKPEVSSKIEGLYEAQTKHLIDLRTLLKLK
jgi:hypothetical protein